MRSEAEKAFYFHADANSLGGFIEKPFQKMVPAQASISLAAVGGHDTRRTEAFNFEEIVSCRSAYTRVSGRQATTGGSASTLITSVVEGLNILEVVTAERLVAQVSVEHKITGGFPLISFTGSLFEGLKIGGCDAPLTLNSSLLACGRGITTSPEGIRYPLFQETGRQQAAKLVKSIEADEEQEEFRWLIGRYGWMASAPPPDGFVLCSLVDVVDPAIPGTSFGHVVEIPDFGRIFLGEILASPLSVRLSMIRAELGCGVSGGVNAAAAGGIGHMVPP
jgi:hypothetical protein